MAALPQAELDAIYQDLTKKIKANVVEEQATTVGVPGSSFLQQGDAPQFSTGFDLGPFPFALAAIVAFIPILLTSMKKADQEAAEKLQLIRDREAAEARDKKMRYESQLSLALDVQKKAEEAKVSRALSAWVYVCVCV
jgi:hypothetical protein